MVQLQQEYHLPKQDEAFIRQAYQLFDDFYAKGTPYRIKCERNEEYYKTNHWEGIARREPNEPQPVTPVLFSTIESILSDLMESYPEAIILPEEEGDEQIAEDLGDILKYILKRRDYRQTFRKKCRQALVCGTSVQEVFWDDSLYGGLGDVNVRSWDVKQFLFDPKCEKMQEGRACFKYGFYTRQWIRENYPGAEEKLKPDTYLREYPDEDDVLVMDYWYKTKEKGQQRVHMAKLAGHVLLEKSEDVRPEGMYFHGKYPFIVEPLYPIAGMPVGMGMVDIFKNLQVYADRLDQIILKNTLMSGKVKMLVNRNADIDEEALTNWDEEVIHASRIDDSSVRWFQPASLNPYVMAHYENKINAIKEESGQNMFSRGEAGKGVTAASAIIALQEASNKRSRQLCEQMFDGFEEMVRMMIDVICENYDEKRIFRIRGEEGTRMIALSSEMLLRKEAEDFERYIEFDVSVQVQQQSAYRTLYQNELALQLLGAGVLSPAECLSMMMFEGKEKVYEQVQQRLALQEEKEQTLLMLEVQKQSGLA